MRWGWLLGAVAVAAVLLLRRRRLPRWLQALGWLGTLAALGIGTGLVPLPDFERLIEDLGEALGTWTYLLVGVLAFLETGAFVGLVAPGETTVIVGGVVAGQGQISLLLLIAITWFAAVAGDCASYFLGRRLGRAWLVRNGPRVKITEERLHQVEDFFERRGGATILLGRFIGIVRALAPFIAGSSKMPFSKFLPYDILGAGAWATTFCVLGYLFWQSFDRLTEYVSRGLFAFGTVVAVGLALYFLVQLRRDGRKRDRVRAWLDRQREHRALRPVLRLAGPAWRLVGRPTATGADNVAQFSWRRLTPGDLGLELTTLLALLAVGAFAFLLLGNLTSGGNVLRIDDWAADGVARVTTPTLLDVARVVTEIGSLPVTAAAATATGAWALFRGRRAAALTLAAGVVLMFVLVNVAKALYGRVRPEDMAYLIDGAAFPSGHSAYAVTWVACAVILVRAGVPWAARFAAVAVAVALVVVVGYTRVYLRVHYLSDVLGGVAMAAAVWSIVGALSLVGSHVRHNERTS